MNITELLTLTKYIEKFENPIAIAVAIVLIVFLLLRKFTTSEYVSAGNVERQQLKDLYDTLNAAHESLKKEFCEQREELEAARQMISNQMREIEELHVTNNNLLKKPD